VVAAVAKLDMISSVFFFAAGSAERKELCNECQAGKGRGKENALQRPKKH
jgi:hypothetical protein